MLVFCLLVDLMLYSYPCLLVTWRETCTRLDYPLTPAASFNLVKYQIGKKLIKNCHALVLLSFKPLKFYICLGSHLLNLTVDCFGYKYKSLMQLQLQVQIIWSNFALDTMIFVICEQKLNHFFWKSYQLLSELFPSKIQLLVSLMLFL